MSARYTFFSGKGGVGKTTMACATAVRWAEQGLRTLIVTTDPASNLADVFEQKIGHGVVPIAAVPNLFAMEIDGDRATDEYKERALAPLRAAFPPEMVRVMEEQMSGPCTSEVAAFDCFTDVIDGAREQDRRFDALIFDTAPTGHTLRLLELPAEWSRVIAASAQSGGQTCIGPAAAIEASKLKYDRALAVLRSSDLTRFVFVLQPEDTSIKEAQRAMGELRHLGIHSFEIIVNGVIPKEEDRNPLFAARRRMQSGYLDRIGRELAIPERRVPLLDDEVKGIGRLRVIARVLFDAASVLTREVIADLGVPVAVRGVRASASAVARVLPDGHSRTLFFAGKGGVGKTTASCVTAVWLARRGLKTLLVTTDPAAHIGDTLGVAVGGDAAPIPGLPKLWAAKVDARAAADAYRARILEDARSRGRSEDSIRAMAEELDSPCTEEMAAFDRFLDFAAQSEWQAIVFDTAPTGHTLRLLELPIDWSKQLDVKIFATVESTAADDVAKRRFAAVIDMMRDPSRSTFVFVMYPESTPVLEAHRAAQELASLGIHAGLVIANQVLTDEAVTTPFGRSRRAMQEKYLSEIAARFRVPVVRIPLFPSEIRGLKALAELGDQILGPIGEVAGDDLVVRAAKSHRA
jgi:arsenite-transporting ATPase